MYNTSVSCHRIYAIMVLFFLFFSTSPYAQTDQENDSGFVPPQAAQSSRKPLSVLWKSSSLPYPVNALAIGDTDGDGENEITLVTSGEIYRYKRENNRFSSIDQIWQSRNAYCIGADIADINHNTIPELVVTALNSRRTSPRSFVLEYDGTRFQKITKRFPWYVRVVAADTDTILVGQEYERRSPFLGDFHVLQWKTDAYEKQKPFVSFGKDNVLGITLDNHTAAYQPNVIFYNEFSTINVYSRTGKLLWESGEPYGSSPLYIRSSKKGNDFENRHYLPMRIMSFDITGDRKNEIIAVKNYEASKHLLGNIRHYTKTRIEILQWDGGGYSTIYQTPVISGHIRDFTIGDCDNDGSEELLAAVVVNSGNILVKKEITTITAYSLKQ